MHTNKYLKTPKGGIPKEHENNNNGSLLRLYVARDKEKRKKDFVLTVSSFITFLNIKPTHPAYPLKIPLQTFKRIGILKKTHCK